eukprot:gene4346-8654_t
MTWAMAKIVHFLAVMYSTRTSLKMLKALSSENQSSNITENLKSKAYSVLMFWAIYGFYMVWEQHFESFFRWLPAYYYFKSFFIGIVAIPQIRITHLVFQDVLVPLVERFYHKLKGDDENGEMPTAVDIILRFPFLLLVLVCPALSHNVEEMSITSNEDTTTAVTPGTTVTEELNSDIDEEGEQPSAVLSAKPEIPAGYSDPDCGASLQGDRHVKDCSNTAVNTGLDTDRDRAMVQGDGEQARDEDEDSYTFVMETSRRLSVLAESRRSPKGPGNVSVGSESEEVGISGAAGSGSDHNHRDMDVPVPVVAGKASTSRVAATATATATGRKEERRSAAAAATGTATTAGNATTSLAEELDKEHQLQHDSPSIRTSIIRSFRSLIVGDDKDSLRSSLDLHALPANSRYRARGRDATAAATTDRPPVVKRSGTKWVSQSSPLVPVGVKVDKDKATATATKLDGEEAITRSRTKVPVPVAIPPSSSSTSTSRFGGRTRPFKYLNTTAVSNVISLLISDIFLKPLQLNSLFNEDLAHPREISTIYSNSTKRSLCPMPSHKQNSNHQIFCPKHSILNPSRYLKSFPKLSTLPSLLSADLTC